MLYSRKGLLYNTRGCYITLPKVPDVPRPRQQGPRYLLAAQARTARARVSSCRGGPEAVTQYNGGVAWGRWPGAPSQLGHRPSAGHCLRQSLQRQRLQSLRLLLYILVWRLCNGCSYLAVFATAALYPSQASSCPKRPRESK